MKISNQIGNHIEKLKEFTKEFGMILLVACAAFTFSLQAYTNIFHIGSADVDSSVFRYVARVILNGGMPYRDTFDHKGPLIYLLNVIGIKIAYWRGIWVIEFITLFVTFYMMYRVARLFMGRLLSFAILLITTSPLFDHFEGGNFTEEYAMPFIAVSIYIFIDYFYNQKISKLRLIICGLCCGAIFMLRPNMCAVWLVMCLAVLMQCIHNRHYQDLGNFIILFAIGLLVIILPILIWLAVNGAFTDFLKDYLYFNKEYSAQTDFSAKFNSFFTFMNRSLMLYALIGLSYIAKKKRSFLDIVYIIYLFVGLIFICISGQTFMHYGMVCIPALVYPVVRISQELYVQGNKVVSEFFILFLTVNLAAPVWINAVISGESQYKSREENFISENEKETVNLISSCSAPNDTILVLGNWDTIYNQSHRFAPTKYSYQNMWADQGMTKEFYDEISANLPKVIVVTKDGTNELDQTFYDNNGYVFLGQTSDQSVKVYVIK